MCEEGKLWSNDLQNSRHKPINQVTHSWICEKLNAEERDGNYTYERCSRFWKLSNTQDQNDEETKFATLQSLSRDDEQWELNYIRILID